MQVFKLKENDEVNIDELNKYLTNLHKDSEGYITIASKNPNYSQWHYKRAVKELYEKGYKQVQIVKDLGLTKGRVSQIIKEIKAKKV